MPSDTVQSRYNTFPTAECMLNFEKDAQAYSVKLKNDINNIKTSAQQVDNKSPTYELDIFALVATY